MTVSQNGQWLKGHKIKGRYEIVDIKQGGLATVYICYDHEFQDAVAVKTFQERFLENSGIVGRFLNEAELWMRLEKHQNIVCAKWVDKINNRPCVFMEYIEGHKEYGSDLSQWLTKGVLSIELVLSIAIQICTGLIYAQRKFAQMGKPFVHRDLKPANIMVTGEGVVKVTDFGLAKVFGGYDFDSEGSGQNSANEISPALTKIGDIFGTPPYMAPEQWVSSSDSDVRADIYSFGCILYEMLVSKPPFIANQSNTFKELHLSQEPDEPERPNEVISDDLIKIVRKCLNKSPQDRYQTFEELRNDLNAANYSVCGNWYDYVDKGEILRIDELSNMAMALHELGKSGEALEYYDRLLSRIADEISPEMVARVFNNRANCYLNLDDFDRALANYLLAKRIDSSYDFPWHNSAGIYMERGDYERALEEVDEAIRINSGYPDSHVRRAEILYVLERNAEAISECNVAISLDPSLHRVYSIRGNCYLKTGEIKKAQEDHAMGNQ